MIVQMSRIRTSISWVAAQSPVTPGRPVSDDAGEAFRTQPHEEQAVRGHPGELSHRRFRTL